jgi:hypothetical protein
MLRTLGVILSGFLILAGGVAPHAVRAQGGAQGYVLDAESVSSVLGGADVTVGLHSFGDWDASVEYSLLDFDVWISASVFPGPDQAHKWVDDVVARLKANNEKTEVQLDAGTALDIAADELYQARLIFKDEDGQRYSEYGRLARIGRAVVLVESIGSPDADDHGVIDNDRALAMVRTFALAIGRLYFYPPDIAKARADMAPFAKEWGKHGMSIKVDATGHGEGTWRVYKWCSDDPTPPCDGMINNMIDSGGHGAFVFHRVSDRTAYGTVVGSTDTESLPLGPITLTVDDQGMAQLSQDGASEPTVLCGPDYLKLAPPAVQAQFPCGA